MFNKHLAVSSLVELFKTDAVLDSASVADAQKDKDDKKGEVFDAAGDYASSDLALKAVAAIQEWAETSTDDLDEGEGLGDRLFSLIAGIADADMDGEIGEDEVEVMMLAAEAAWDYLLSKEVPEDDIGELLNEFDNDVASRVQELIVDRLPDGAEETADEMDSFVFGDGSDESALDAVYKKKIVIRKGKKVRINKRISGTVRLSAKQKVAVRKMLRKSHSAVATMRRAKSMRLAKKSK